MKYDLTFGVIRDKAFLLGLVSPEGFESVKLGVLLSLNLRVMCDFSELL